MSESNPHAGTIVVRDPEKLRALADPMRQAILVAFATPKTTKQVATELGIKGTKLYHHVDILERHGFLRLVETRPKRGTVERVLQVTATRIVADLGTDSDRDSAIRETLDQVARELLQAPHGAFEPVLMRAGVRIHPDDFPKIEEAFKRMLSELQNPEGEVTSFFLAASQTPRSEP